MEKVIVNYEKVLKKIIDRHNFTTIGFLGVLEQILKMSIGICVFRFNKGFKVNFKHNAEFVGNYNG